MWLSIAVAGEGSSLEGGGKGILSWFFFFFYFLVQRLGYYSFRVIFLKGARIERKIFSVLLARKKKKKKAVCSVSKLELWRISDGERE